MADDAKVEDGDKGRLRKALKQLRKDREEKSAARELLEEVQQDISQEYYFLVDENTLDANLLLLTNRDAWWCHSVCSTCCRLLQVVRAFLVLLQFGRVLLLVRSQYGPII